VIRADVTLRRLTAMLLVAMGCASGNGTSAHVRWHDEMQAAGAAVDEGDAVAGAEHFRQALAASLQEPSNPNEVAYAAWHLGDLCFKHPTACRAGEAEAGTGEALAIFEIHYGPEHPVVIPVLLRMAEIRAGEGDAASAAALREKADRITARTFPESHFMRARMGTHRPAADLHPQELLRILADVDPLGG
jgi:hypothetical protein